MDSTIEMSAALQVALFLASIAIVVLVAFLIPTALQARRHLEQLALAAEHSKVELEILLQDGRELIRNVSNLSKRATQQMDNVDQVVGTVRQWTERADRIVDEVGSAIEPPVFTLVKNMNKLRTGATAFMQALFHRNHNNNQTKEQQNAR